MEKNRALAPDFDAVIMADAGHYPMLEQPDEFDRHLSAIVAGLVRQTRGTERGRSRSPGASTSIA